MKKLKSNGSNRKSLPNMSIEALSKKLVRSFLGTYDVIQDFLKNYDVIDR